MNFILFTIDGCTKCFKAKKLLENNGVDYIEKNVLHDLDARTELIELVNEVIVPILINKGNNEILKWNQLQLMYK
ncbi:glutaredoxin family protein [Bacillus sp. DJP31]|uniref:glutaredoxin family protein n=1 Tax=Bacillus sp. DJP31 TaxID=3409789 RepID=UPI003BB78090